MKRDKISNRTHINNLKTAIFVIVRMPQKFTRKYITYLGVNVYIAQKTSEIQEKIEKGAEIKAYLPNRGK